MSSTPSPLPPALAGLTVIGLTIALAEQRLFVMGFLAGAIGLILFAAVALSH
jgi:hypothetical protein